MLFMSTFSGFNLMPDWCITQTELTSEDSDDTEYTQAYQYQLHHHQNKKKSNSRLRCFDGFTYTKVQSMKNGKAIFYSYTEK